MSSSGSAPVLGHNRKRRWSDNSNPGLTHKIRRTPLQPQDGGSRLQIDSTDQESLSRIANLRKRQNRHSDTEGSKVESHQRKKRSRPEASSTSTSVSDWVSHLPSAPQDFERIPESEDWEAMSRPPASKRTRSNSAASEASLDSDTETNTTLSRQFKNAIYKNPRYPMVMESKGSFMRDSEQGPLPEELELLKILQTRKEGFSSVHTLGREHLGHLRDLLRNSSELRVCIDLHPYLVPSAGILAMLNPDKIKHLTEGHNDRWLDNHVFCEKLPQPDRTLAFSLSAFTDVERRKLKLGLGTTSPFIACHGALFPFFAAEVKCGKEALDVADNANLNSMTIAQRAVFELYSRAGAGQASKIHRRFLGFSISHDEESVRIYGHYPEIINGKITFYRKGIRAFYYADDEAKEGDTSAQFLWNIYTHFAPLHLMRLKEAISDLPEPFSPPVDSPSASQTLTVSGDDVTPPTPATSTSGPAFTKPALPHRHTSATVAQQVEQQRREMMVQFEQLQKSSEQQRQEAKAREDKLLAQMEQQQQEAKAREDKLLAQMEQQQQEAKAREDKLLDQMQQQHTQFMALLTQKAPPAQQK